MSSFPVFETNGWPGLSADNEEEIVLQLLSGLPKYPLVQIGVLLGRTTANIARNFSETIYAIDRFDMPVELLLQSMVDANCDVTPVLGCKTHYSMASNLLSEFPQVQLIQASFNENFEWDKTNQLSCVLDDSDHYCVQHIVDFWWPMIVPGGIICGQNWQMPSVHNVVKHMNPLIIPRSNYWLIRKLS